jgi:hypothetical protein
MIEPVQRAGAVSAMLRASEEPPKSASLRESMVEPITKQPEYGKQEPVKMQREKNEAQIEAVKENKAAKADLRYNPSQEINKEAHDSMVEPIKGDRALLGKMPTDSRL